MSVIKEGQKGLTIHDPYPAQTRGHMVCSAYRYGMDYSGLKEPLSLSVDRQAAPGIPGDAKQSKKEAAVKSCLESLSY